MNITHDLQSGEAIPFFFCSFLESYIVVFPLTAWVVHFQPTLLHILCRSLTFIGISEAETKNVGVEHEMGTRKYPSSLFLDYAPFLHAENQFTLSLPLSLLHVHFENQIQFKQLINFSTSLSLSRHANINDNTNTKRAETKLQNSFCYFEMAFGTFALAASAQQRKKTENSSEVEHNFLMSNSFRIGSMNSVLFL